MIKRPYVCSEHTQGLGEHLTELGVHPMPKVTLASGQVHMSDELTVELINSTDEPARIRIVWPAHATITTPASYAEAAAAAMRVLANASTELSRLKARKHR
jgi:hypothetical protein